MNDASKRTEIDVFFIIVFLFSGYQLFESQANTN